MLNITKIPCPINDFENHVDGFKNTYENKDFKVKLNGKEVTECYLTYEEITNGGEITFELK